MRLRNCCSCTISASNHQVLLSLGSMEGRRSTNSGITSSQTAKVQSCNSKGESGRINSVKRRKRGGQGVVGIYRTRRWPWDNSWDLERKRGHRIPQAWRICCGTCATNHVVSGYILVTLLHIGELYDTSAVVEQRVQSIIVNLRDLVFVRPLSRPFAVINRSPALALSPRNGASCASCSAEEFSYTNYGGESCGRSVGRGIDIQ